MTDTPTAADAVAAATDRQQTDDDQPVAYQDGRIQVNHAELWETRRWLQKQLTEDWLKSHRESRAGGDVIGSEGIRAIIIGVLQSINLERLNHPEGTIARNVNGDFACRYYSSRLGKLIWVIVAKPSDAGIEVTDSDDLPPVEGATSPAWKVLYQPDWPVEI